MRKSSGAPLALAGNGVRIAISIAGRRKWMEYRNLVTFLRVAELQNFTQAAGELGYAQSTVTFHIQSLEEELGVVLFDRIGKKVSLTIAGEALLHYANEMVRLENEMSGIGKQLENLSGTLRVGVVESILYTYAEKIIFDYHRQYPDVKLEIYAYSSIELLDRLKENQVDMAVFIGKKIADPFYKRDLIKTVNVHFVTSAKHQLASQKNIGMEAILQEPLVLPEKESLYRRMAEEAAAYYDRVLEPVVQVNNTSTIMELLKSGLGISFLPDYLTLKEVEKGTLVNLDVENPMHRESYIQVLHHKNKWITPQMQCFMEVMKKALDMRE